MERSVAHNLIVLEGLDGSGTTTQTELLVERFTRVGVRCAKAWEPSDGEIGRLARRVLRKQLRVEPRTLALLFAADRNEHLAEPSRGMLSLARSGVKVVCDRYLFSSLAYQSAGSGFDYVLGLNEGFPLPEHLIFLDVPPAECQRRMAGRDGVDLFEHIELQESIVAFYRRGIDHFRDSPMNVAIVDGTGTREAVHEKIWSFLSGAPIERM